MFVEYSTMVEVGMAEVERRFDTVRSGPYTTTDVVYADEQGLVSRVGPKPGLAREVTLDIGPAEIHKSGLVYPIHWVAKSAEALFPELNADLKISHAGPSHTRLSIRGTYQPPLGAVGRLVDRAVLRRVAEATVVDWLDRLTTTISQERSQG